MIKSIDIISDHTIRDGHIVITVEIGSRAAMKDLFRQLDKVFEAPKVGRREARPVLRSGRATIPTKGTAKHGKD